MVEEAARVRSLLAGIALTVIAMAPFLVLPVYVGAAADALGFSQRQLGLLAAAVAAGSALSSVGMMFLVRRLPWRPLATATLLLLLLPMVASIFVDHAAGFMALQSLAALGGGSTYSLALTALADDRHPDRAFGLSIAAQVVFQVWGMLVLPNVVAAGGIDGVLSVFIALELAGLLLARWLPAGGPAVATAAGETATGETAAADTTVRAVPHTVAGRGTVAAWPVWLALAGCFLFFFNVGAVWTYLERMAVLAGFEAQRIGTALAVGVAFGIPGALLASWCGDRYGRVAPLAVGAVGTVLALGLLGQGMTFTTYLLGAALYNFVWNFSLAFQYAAVNAVDPGGRAVAAAPAFHGAGAAVGPGVAALLVTETSLVAVNVLAGVAVTLSFVLFAVAIMRHRKYAR